MLPDEWEIVKAIVQLTAFDWGIIPDLDPETVTADMIERAHQIMTGEPTAA